MSQPQFTGFHAHIYFEPATRASADQLRLRISEHLGSLLRYQGKLIDRPVGPHPVPMFEIDFTPEHFTTVVPFLMKEHGVHSVLIHPESGNDLLDHSQHALWLGIQLKLDLSIF